VLVQRPATLAFTGPKRQSSVRSRASAKLDQPIVGARFRRLFLARGWPANQTSKGCLVAVRRPSTIENLLLKPYLWRRPSQLVRRLLYDRSSVPNAVTVRLPWGLMLQCDPTEMIGQSILRTGVFEMVTTEALVRLADPGELVLDVGANVGYMTSVLARAAGPTGRVIAYEPNPAVYERLARNVEGWDGVATIELRRAAVSERNGTAPLTIPEGRSEWASVGDVPGQRATAPAYSTVSVEIVTLDHELADRHVGVLKLDVEDHEPAALRGARTALEQGRIRDILFEDHSSYPSATTRALEQHGYSVFDLASRGLGVALHRAERQVTYPSWDAPMRLGTLDPARAERRLSARGWRSLGNPLRWHQPRDLG
jgi:FkbM family methyltransferase